MGWARYLLAAAALCGTAAAQQPEERARESAERSLEAEDPGFSPARSSARIPFSRVLAAPDDVRLNLDYARQEIAAGDLKEAAAALERTLILHPALGDVRVLYGLVLYRLGLLDRARFELEQALSGDLEAEPRAQAESALARIRSEQKRTRGSLTVSVGAEWDDNRNQAPSSGEILFIGIPLPAQPQRGDVAFVVSAQGRLLHDLGYQAGHALVAEAGYHRSDKSEVDALDLDAATLSAGVAIELGPVTVTPRVRGAHYWLAGEDYLVALGGEMEILARLSPRVSAVLTARGEDEDFREVTDFPSAGLRSGRRLSLRPALRWRPHPSVSAAVEGLWMDKKGAVDFESYERVGAGLTLSKLFARGAFAEAAGAAERSGYDGPDPFISPDLREEWLYRGRASLGAPLAYFAPRALPEAFGSIYLIARYEYETVDSSIVNFDYGAHRASLTLSKRFGL